MELAGFEIPDREIELSAVRAGGPGGQHVNKVSSAIHLRFDFEASSLPEHCKQRLRNLTDRRVQSGGVVVIKAQRFRSQEQNRQDALQRLEALLARAMFRPAPRIATRPTAGSRKRRLADKKARSQVKKLRQSLPSDD